MVKEEEAFACLDQLRNVVYPAEAESLASIADSLKEIVLQLNFLSAMAKERNDHER